MLGVLIAAECAAFLWFLDKTVRYPSGYTITIMWLLLIPILISVLIAFRLHGERSPNALWFNDGLVQSEYATLSQAVTSIMEDYD